MNRKVHILVLLSLLVALLAVANIFLGSVSIPAPDVLNILAGHGSPEHPSWDYIIRESRIPQVITASLCGAALSTCGLLLQTLFRNPLAGPNILGIDSGANLGVALVMLLLGGSMTLGSVSLSGYLLIILAAMVGACAIMALLMLLANYLHSPVMLLITGVIISYVTSSIISMLNFRATEEGVHNYIIWGFWAPFCSSSPLMPCCWATAMHRTWASTSGQSATASSSVPVCLLPLPQHSAVLFHSWGSPCPI